MSGLTTLSLLVSLLLVTVTSAVKPKVVFIDTYCVQGVNLTDYPVLENQDILIRMDSNSPNQKANYDCSMTLTSNNLGMRLRAKFMNFAASDHRDNQCSQGAIQIFDEKGTAVRSPYCENDTPTQSYDMGKFGTVNVFNQNWTQGDMVTFDLLVTPVSIKSQFGQCPTDFFDCQEQGNACVSNSLKCNGYDDCLDGRDERVCDDGGISDVAVAFIVLTFVFVVFVIGAAVMLRRQRRAGWRELGGENSEKTRVLN